MEISIAPVAYIKSETKTTDQMPFHGVTSKIVLEPGFVDGLKNIELNSHLWVLCWFHESRRDLLLSSPKRINPDCDEYGVFALRTPSRPNPIALTLVKLLQVEGDVLTVSGLDGIDGTPILDIKPYFEKDIIFAPMTPYIRPSREHERWKLFYELAVNHYGQDCEELCVAVEMALYAEDRLGRLTDAELAVDIKGSACLVDVMQALTRARLGEQGRFVFEISSDACEVTWKRGAETLTTYGRDFLENARKR